LLLGSVVIIAFRVSRSWASAVFLIVFASLVRFAGGLYSGEAIGKGDALFALCSGGTVVTAFILSADPASGPKSRLGILCTTVLTAVLAWLIRYPGSELYGCFFAVVLVNALTPVVRLLEYRRFYFQKPRVAEADPEARK
jgi:electron transport complex protein RnfD